MSQLKANTILVNFWLDCEQTFVNSHQFQRKGKFNGKFHGKFKCKSNGNNKGKVKGKSNDKGNFKGTDKCEFKGNGSSKYLVGSISMATLQFT